MSGIGKLRNVECQKKGKNWYHKNTVMRAFRMGYMVLVLAMFKPHKKAVNWVDQGKVTGVISDTNYTVEILRKKKQKDDLSR